MTDSMQSPVFSQQPVAQKLSAQKLSEQSTDRIGMLLQGDGMILQRGGEELTLEKISDRFTACLKADQSLANFAQEAKLQVLIPAMPLVEFVVEPEHLEQAMQTARMAEEIAFVSHVYQMKQSPGTPLYLTDQITIQFAEGVEAAAMRSIASRAGIQVVRLVAGVAKTFVFRLTQQARANPLKLANQLVRCPEVLLAEPNIAVQIQSFYRPKDAGYSQQWYLNHYGGEGLAAGSHVAAEAAWDITRGDRSVVVAIVDDGVDLDHPDFQAEGKIVAPVDFKNGDFLPLPEQPQHSHGTVCARLAIAEENGQGNVGIAPGCALMPIRINNFLDDQAVEQAFEWATQQGAAVISCGWGASAVYFPLSLRQRAALTRAATQGRAGKGCVIVFAAGNANRPIAGVVNEQGWANSFLQGSTPWLNGFAVHPDVITVSASTSLNQKSACSNWGDISVAAPANNAAASLWLPETGEMLLSPAIDPLPGKSGSEGGTSSAGAIVAGAAALILSVNPSLTAQEVRQLLQATADKIVDVDPDPASGLSDGSYDARGHSQWFGYGKVNAFKAVQAAQQRLVFPPLPARWIQQENITPVEIPDYAPEGITSAIQIHETSPVLDIEVGINVEHTFMGDLEIYLIPPTGQAIMLQTRTLGRTSSFRTIYTPQTHPLLAEVLYRPAIGQWQLKLVDRVLQNTGCLKSWRLSLGI